MKKESWGRRFWRLIYPELTYFGVTYVVEFFAIAAIGFYVILRESMDILDDFSAFYVEVVELAMDYTVEMQTVAAIITLPILILYYRMDRKRDKKAGRAVRYTAVEPVKYIIVFLLGAILCLLANNVVVVSGVYSVSSTYTEISQAIFNGKFIIELIGLGVIVPVVEELIFRGLLYRRFREYSGVIVSGVFSALIFAAYHGNLVQGIYAFVIGAALVYVYERYHSMLAPILLHIAANLISVIGSETNLFDGMYSTLKIFWAVTIAAALILIGLVYLIEMFVYSYEIGPEEAPPDERPGQDEDQQ